MKLITAPDTETPSCRLLSFLLLRTVVTGLWMHTTELDLVEKGMCLAYLFPLEIVDHVVDGPKNI